MLSTERWASLEGRHSWVRFVVLKRHGAQIRAAPLLDGEPRNCTLNRRPIMIRGGIQRKPGCRARVNIMGIAKTLDWQRACNGIVGCGRHNVVVRAMVGPRAPQKSPHMLTSGVLLLPAFERIYRIFTDVTAFS